MQRLIEHVDPPFYEYLKHVCAEDCLFVFRWLLLCFKREFSHSSLCRVWEVFWCAPLPDFQTFFTVALVLRVRDTVLERSMQADDILLLVNNHMKGEHDPQEVLADAEHLYHKFEVMYDSDEREDILAWDEGD